MITQERLRELLEYDAKRGKFLVKRRIGKLLAGSYIKGCDNGKGYLACRLEGRRYYLHRLAWFYVYGWWPREIDHINAVKSDNRIENLRECSHFENAQNIPRKHGSRQGANFEARTGKWYARIKVKGRCVHLGTFTTKELAESAYVEAKRILHPFQPTIREATQS